MADDHGPKIAPRRRNQQSHQNAECAGDRDAEWILVSMRCPEQRTLRDTSAYPCAATPTNNIAKPCIKNPRNVNSS